MLRMEFHHGGARSCRPTSMNWESATALAALGWNIPTNGTDDETNIVVNPTPKPDEAARSRNHRRDDTLVALVVVGPKESPSTKGDDWFNISLANYVADMWRHLWMSPISCRHSVSLQHRRGPAPRYPFISFNQQTNQPKPWTMGVDSCIWADPASLTICRPFFRSLNFPQHR
jgi:hypothetical protein